MPGNRSVRSRSGTRTTGRPGSWSTYNAKVHVGCRDDDEGTTEATQTLAAVIPASQVVSDPAGSLSLIRKALAAQDLEGYWLHIDVDVLDPAFMPAVDSPDPGGLNPQQLITLLGELAADAVGAAVCILDPDLDPDGSCAQLVADVTYEALSGLGAVADRP
ncbi:arginase family protein [Kribbella sancticallisti]|uniref:arginase family protein n=1 Tax=Kribbella sancticallisti TaxID=460087 RepID=UPI003CD05E5A